MKTGFYFESPNENCCNVRVTLTAAGQTAGEEEEEEEGARGGEEEEERGRQQGHGNLQEDSHGPAAEEHRPPGLCRPLPARLHSPLCTHSSVFISSLSPLLP